MICNTISNHNYFGRLKIKVGKIRLEGGAMFYKPSKFNYHIETKNGDVLLINIYTGFVSLVKVEKDNKDYVLNLLAQDKVEDDKSAIFKSMVDKGFFVEESVDEDQKLKLLYTNRISDNTLNLTILPTEQCNYRCKYCYESFERGKMSQEVQDAIVKFVKENIHNYRGLNVGWFGGEPLIALDVIENLSKQFIDICQRNRVPYIADVTSNGYLLTADTLKKLYKLHVSTYTITIDGIRETHNEQKPLANGDPTFDTVIQNLLDIKNTVKNRFFSITLRTNFTPKIHEHIKEYVDFFYDNFGDDDRFTFFTRPAGDWGGDTVKAFSDSLFERDAFEDAVFKDLLDYDKTLRYDRHVRMMSPGGSMCNLSMTHSLLFDSAGNVRKCSCNLDDDETIIGNIKDGNVDIDVNKMAKWVNYYEPVNQCKDCFFAPACLDNSCLAKQVLYHTADDCQVYEKKNIGYVLQLFDKTEKIEVLK